MLTSQTATAGTAPRLSSKALKLVVASKSPKSLSAKSPRGTKRTDAKTSRKKDSIPALAGNFQDRDEIELKISYRDVITDANNVEGTRETTPSKKKKKKKSQSKNSDVKIIAVYSTTKRKKEADRYEGRDETESTRLPPGCTELGHAPVLTSSDSASFQMSVKNTFSIYKMKDIVVAIYDNSERHQLLGYVRFSLHKLVCDRTGMESRLQGGRQISIVATPTDTKMKNLRFRFNGRGLGENKALGVHSSLQTPTPDPFLVVSYQRANDCSSSGNKSAKNDPPPKENNRWEALWKSNVVRGSNDPLFAYGQLPTAKLSADTSMCITALDYDDKAKQHSLIGQSRMTYHQLLASAGVVLRHNKMATGYIGIDHMDMTLVPSLSHYLSQGGLELDLMVAIDFTRNNMQIDDSEYQDSRSFLHRIRSSGKMNGYQLALTTIAGLFQELESREKCTHTHIWGFGAEDLKGNVKNRLRMGRDKGRVRGVDGLLNAYNETATSNISMGDQKDLRSSLYTAIARAEMNSSAAKLNYSVLLVLCCEGMIHELNETLEQICEASYTPLSIIFVGVGGGTFTDFQDMANDQTTSPSGMEFMRECVSFVHLDEYRQDPNKLLKAALHGLPKQIVQYHMSKQIRSDGGGGQSLEDEDDQQVDVDLCPSNHLPHLLGEESVDMAEVSAYVSPCSSTDESDNSNEQSREDQDVLMAHLEGSLMGLEVSQV